MNRELEAKIRVDDATAIERRLRDVGGEPLFDAIIGDTFFDTADGRLHQSGSGMRIRTARRSQIGGGPGDDAAAITFKGPRQPGAVKIREEIEFSVGDAAAARRFLERLGYVEKLGYEKHRRSWRIGACRVELDDVPLLGTFVEIEGPDEAAIAEVQRQLGLDGHAQEMSSYASMLDEHLSKHGMRERHVPFRG